MLGTQRTKKKNHGVIEQKNYVNAFALSHNVLCSPRNFASVWKIFEFFASKRKVSWGNAEVLPKHCNIFFLPCFFPSLFPFKG